MAFDPTYLNPSWGQSYDPMYNLYNQYFPQGLSNDQLQQIWSTLQSATPQQQGVATGSNSPISQWGPDNQAAINQLNLFARQFANQNQGQAAAAVGAPVNPSLTPGQYGGATYGQQSYLPGAGGAGSWGGAGGAAGGVGGAGGGGGGSMAANTTATNIPYGVSLPQWQAWYGANQGKTVLVNGQAQTIGSDISADQLLSAYRNQTMGFGAPTVGTLSGQQAANAQQPESVALQQMAQIDPASEALRQGLGLSYLSTLGASGPTTPFQMPQSGNAAPNAADVQSYLNLYKQIDPQGYQQRVNLAGSESDFLNQMQQQYALGSQLTTGQAREVDQATREAQAARGNVYGTPQLVQEAMTRGQYGIQLEQQRQQNLANALAGQQGYLQSGTGIGDVANALYNQGVNRYTNAWQTQQNALLNQRNQALSYLGSGQTPYEAGASYYDRAQANAQQAASYGAPTYQPSALGQQYTGGGAGSYPQYGLQIGNQATNWYNSMVNQNYGLGQLANQQSAQSSALGGGIGSAAGSVLGGVVGSFVPVVGTVAGAALGGAVGGAAGRAMSA